jgi:hypothetical protein
MQKMKANSLADFVRMATQVQTRTFGTSLGVNAGVDRLATAVTQ